MRFDAIIFDIDNVLVDTSASYTDCIRKTVEIYLETQFRFQPSRVPLLTRSDVEQFKSLGGFNDDWDTCCGLLLYFLSLKLKRRRLNELRKIKNITRLLKTVHVKPLGVRGAEKKFGGKKQIQVGRVVDIFQKLYLSEYVWNEKLIIPKNYFKHIKKNQLQLGILTGRSREEALFALKRFQIDDFFDVLITQDETPGKLRKPNPYGLFKIAGTLGKQARYLYVGDLPDDMLTAKRAKKKMRISSCGFLGVSNTPQEMQKNLKKAGADSICRNTKELLDLILK
jgi:HAD superfamily hydrolase (TIGR01548 family)